MATTETSVTQLKINKLTKAQYDSITTPSATELYFVKDEAIDYNDLINTPNLATVATTGDYEDLINLDDWIPFLITSNLPQEVFFKLGKNIENKEEYNNRLLRHKIENGKSGLSLDESLENEVSIFLEKYPKFQPLFSVNE